jgi:DNA-binding HxlR family transcriptional regulator
MIIAARAQALATEEASIDFSCLDAADGKEREWPLQRTSWKAGFQTPHAKFCKARRHTRRSGASDRNDPPPAPLSGTRYRDLRVQGLTMANRLACQFGCPIELATTLVRGKWTGAILLQLGDEPLRYGRLRTKLPELSDKVLTARLRELEEFGLIERQPAPIGTRPGHLYRLTDLGLSLRPALESLSNWGKAAASAFGVRISVQT